MAVLSILFPCSAFPRVLRFGENLCQEAGYTCHEVQEDETWDSLWPEESERDLVKRVNRMNTRLRPGMILAVPQNLEKQNRLGVAPFPAKIDSFGEKEIQVDLKQLAWAAYDAEGNLTSWGPAAGGKDYCPDVGRACRTHTGEFYIRRVGGPGCKSKKFPIPHGGAPMPYCMYYYDGYALHGSYTVPGYNASHGCVRIFPEDARWLNREFIDDMTRVRVLPY
ncbi:MAG TPA: L,D-transpeptidase [Deltaproteobacteria bacterium]|nr:L,D-transpeptidase [Deltaproteobacteria bacterium]